jgi:hypothetical protein
MELPILVVEEAKRKAKAVTKAKNKRKLKQTKKSVAPPQCTFKG